MHIHVLQDVQDTEAQDTQDGRIAIPEQLPSCIRATKGAMCYQPGVNVRDSWTVLWVKLWDYSDEKIYESIHFRELTWFTHVDPVEKMKNVEAWSHAHV